MNFKAAFAIAIIATVFHCAIGLKCHNCLEISNPDCWQGGSGLPVEECVDINPSTGRKPVCLQFFNEYTGASRYCDTDTIDKPTLCKGFGSDAVDCRTCETDLCNNEPVNVN